MRTAEWAGGSIATWLLLGACSLDPADPLSDAFGGGPQGPVSGNDGTGSGEEGSSGTTWGGTTSSSGGAETSTSGALESTSGADPQTTSVGDTGGGDAGDGTSSETTGGVGPQPGSGMWSHCTDPSMCDEGLGCLSNDGATDGYCSSLCEPAGDPSGCATPPAGTGVTCTMAGGGESVCALDCSSGKPCPTGMVCSDTQICM